MRNNQTYIGVVMEVGTITHKWHTPFHVLQTVVWPPEFGRGWIQNRPTNLYVQ